MSMCCLLRSRPQAFPSRGGMVEVVASHRWDNRKTSDRIGPCSAEIWEDKSPAFSPVKAGLDFTLLNEICTNSPEYWSTGATRASGPEIDPAATTEFDPAPSPTIQLSEIINNPAPSEGLAVIIDQISAHLFALAYDNPGKELGHAATSIVNAPKINIEIERNTRTLTMTSLILLDRHLEVGLALINPPHVVVVDQVPGKFDQLASRPQLKERNWVYGQSSCTGIASRSTKLLTGSRETYLTERSNQKTQYCHALFFTKRPALIGSIVKRGSRFRPSTFGMYTPQPIPSLFQKKSAFSVTRPNFYDSTTITIGKCQIADTFVTEVKSPTLLLTESKLPTLLLGPKNFPLGNKS
ncbi:hypothetical protein B0H13DRAFT_1854881 [Mycena leptocephala]|nr:hypothetical protein B0H13DRAFT_1854881 [Mycena leptocephala]